MNPQTPTTGDFSTGPHVPLWLVKLLHHKWRFYIAATIIICIGGLAFLGIKMPWKSSHVSERPRDAGQISTGNLVALPGTSHEGGDGASADQSDSSGGSQSGDSSSASNGGASGGSGGSGGSSGGSGTGGGSGGGSSGGGGSGGSSPTGCAAGTTAEGGFTLPNLCGYANGTNTGPRYACTTTLNGTITTSSNGQVFDRVCINGILRINHNNVTLRDVLIMGTATYALDIGRNAVVCPTNIRVEYTEVNMSNAGQMDWGVYQRCAGGHVFDHMKVINAGRGMMTYGNITITNSYFYSYRTAEGAHRTALSTHGGDNYTVTGNTFICVNLHCSSSVNMYSDYAPVTNYLFQANVLAGGSICLRGGQTHNYPNDTHDIRVLNNRFSTYYFPECGSLQAFAQFDAGAPGNVRSGNVWHESGQSLPGG